MANKIVLPIRGLHCKSCEMLVEEELNKISGVDKANVNYRSGQAIISYQGKEPTQEELDNAVRTAGYEIGTDQESKSFFSSNVNVWRDFGWAVIFFVGLYLLIRGLGFNNLSLDYSGAVLTVPLILLIGLTAGVSTCMALVGGLVIGIFTRYNEQHPEKKSWQKFQPHLFFNLGRVLAYFILGGLLGVLGSVLQLSTLFLGILTIVIGLVMLVMGLQLIEIFPIMNKIKFTLPKSVARIFGLKKTEKYSHFNSFLLGASTFFLPCGFTTAMQIYAIGTGSFFGGAIVMGAFALGTVPGLLSLGGLTAFAKGIFAKRFFKLLGLALIAFALFNITNGFGLAGVTVDFSSAKQTIVTEDPNVVIENGVQIVKMKETNRGYEPNSFTIKKDLPVKWVIDAQAPYSCASSILMPKYNIRQNLVKGENIIQFTPTTLGQVKFSCSMGMYTGNFNVVE